MKFNNPSKKTKVELQTIFNSNDINSIIESLVALAMYEQDWRWAQNICLKFLDNNNLEISRVAATCLAHIARIHHKLDKEKVISALMKKVNDPIIGGTIQDTLDDIEMFL